MNQKPLFLVVFLTALVVIGGAFCFMSRRPASVTQSVVTDPAVETSIQTGPENPSDTSDWKPQQEVTKTFEPVTGEDGWVWFPIPELGIEIKVKKDFKPELKYQVTEFRSPEDGGKYAQFTTKRLMDIGKKNGLGLYSEGQYVCSIGTFVLYNNLSKDDLEMSKKSGSYVDEKDSTSVIFRSPQSGCSKNNEVDADYEQSLVLNWLKRVDGIQEPLAKSVRKIK